MEGSLPLPQQPLKFPGYPCAWWLAFRGRAKNRRCAHVGHRSQLKLELGCSPCLLPGLPGMRGSGVLVFFPPATAPNPGSCPAPYGWEVSKGIDRDLRSSSCSWPRRAAGSSRSHSSTHQVGPDLFSSCSPAPPPPALIGSRLGGRVST